MKKSASQIKGYKKIFQLSLTLNIPCPPKTYSKELPTCARLCLCLLYCSSQGFLKRVKGVVVFSQYLEAHSCLRPTQCCGYNNVVNWVLGPEMLNSRIVQDNPKY